MINLINGRLNSRLEIKGSDYSCKLEHDIIINEFNISALIRNTLSTAAGKGELINTQGLRGIGKTYELVCFAKENGYAVISPNAKYVKECIGYDLVYSNINQIRGFKLKGLVVDEGINLADIQELKDYGFNIVTGYYTETKKNKSFHDNIIDTLKTEIECLTPKIQKARQSHDFGTYKNLILAYREIVQLLKYTQENKLNV